MHLNITGSGPAYFFYMLEAIEQAAIELGMPKEIARGLAAQTCLGAGKMALAEMEDPAILRRNVTSPKGTTEAAIKVFDGADAKKIMVDAVVAATKRADELANILGAQVCLDISSTHFSDHNLTCKYRFNSRGLPHQQGNCK
jgi:pyrroline-5-carboxylate reductase